MCVTGHLTSWSVWTLLTLFPVRLTGYSRAEYEGPESTAPSSAISGGSVAAERSFRTPGTLAPVFPVLAYALGPYACSIFFLFIVIPVPSLACPLYRPKFHLSFPKRRSQRGVVVSRA